MLKAAPATVASLLLASTLACAGGSEPDLGTTAERGEGMRREREPAGSWEEREGEEREEAMRPADPELARQVDQALDRVLADGDRAGVEMLAECGDDGSLTETRIFGSGVGIWNRNRQFTVPPGRVTRLLEAFRKAGFSRFQELYGDIEDEVPIPGGSASALQVICRVALTIGDVTKQSAQLSDGPRSDELHELADRILGVGRRQGSNGVMAASLDDGLAKIADGALAPEVLSVLVHRKPDTRPGEDGGEGFLLRIEGGRVSVRRYTSGTGYGEPVVSDLGPEEAARLARRLADARPGELPLNLYALEYTDLVIQVMDRKTQIQARAFTGMSRSTHGADQTRFDTLYDALAELAELRLEAGARADHAR